MTLTEKLKVLVSNGYEIIINEQKTTGLWEVQFVKDYRYSEKFNDSKLERLIDSFIREVGVKL